MVLPAATTSPDLVLPAATTSPDHMYPTPTLETRCKDTSYCASFRGWGGIHMVVDSKPLVKASLAARIKHCYRNLAMRSRWTVTLSNPS